MNCRMGINEVAKILQRMLESAEIDTSERKMTNTSVRKGMCTTLLRNNIPTTSVMKQMGHKNPNSLTNYDCSTTYTEQKVTEVLYNIQSKRKPEFETCSEDHAKRRKVTVSSKTNYINYVVEVFF